MTRARREQICLEETPYYHCTARCVRRAFLCGFDHYANTDYEHRRQWVLDRMNELAEVFTIHIAAYAIMSNHYHLVVQVDRQAAEELNHFEIAKRWGRLFGANRWVERWRRAEATRAEAELAIIQIEEWRTRLYDLSWYMRCLNEHIARKANAEDQCKGHFWEGRYKCQALLDETALLTCMSYVDLNPIRAGMAATPEQSDYTSLQQRIGERYRLKNTKSNLNPCHLPLLPLLSSEHRDNPRLGIPCDVENYLALVDWTGCSLRDDKHGFIPATQPPILKRLQLTPEQWLQGVTYAGHEHGLARGAKEKLQQYAKRLKRCWIRVTQPCAPPEPNPLLNQFITSK